jgi:hypothetical protein
MAQREIVTTRHFPLVRDSRREGFQPARLDASLPSMNSSLSNCRQPSRVLAFMSLLVAGAAIICLTAAPATAAPTQSFTVSIKTFCQNTTHNQTRCASGYKGFQGTLTHYEIYVNSGTFGGTIFRGSKTTCTAINISYWSSNSDATFSARTTTGTTRGTTGNSHRMGTLKASISRGPYVIALRDSDEDSLGNIYVNGSLTCTTKTGT